MPKPKIIIKNNKKAHVSVGAIIKKGKKYLLLERKIKPFGFAPPAGHVDIGETPLNALIREVKEESGLDVYECKLLLNELKSFEKCVYGLNSHYWYIYECKTKGKLKINSKEEKSINWYTLKEIKKLKLEKAWNYWFKELSVF